MKKIILGLFLFIFPAISLMAGGKVIESLKFKSGTLGKEVSYSIYLPEDYDTSNRLYPVLYLLHGWSDNETSWIQMGDIKRIADEAIQENITTPMIIVMPNAWETWYVNSYDGKDRYEDMFFEELIPEIEKSYRTRPSKQYRAIAGLSMGGYGSFLYSLHHPDAFVACAPLSAAVFTDEQIEKNKGGNLSILFDKIFGKGNLTEHWHRNSVIELFSNLKEGELPKVNYYIDCGDEDTLLHGNNLIHEIMQQKGIKHEFRVRDGGHTWTYWRTALPEVMRFMSKQFNRS